MGLRKMRDIIGDPETFIKHMCNDAMIGSKDNLPPKDKPIGQLNHEVFVQQWEEDNNKCKTGHDGSQKTQQNSSVKTSPLSTKRLSKRSKTDRERIAKNKT